MTKVEIAHGESLAIELREVAMMVMENGALTIILKGNSTPVVIANGGGSLLAYWKEWAISKPNS